MSARVDALVVLDLARESLRNSRQRTPQGLALHDAVAEVRATMAELIDRDRKYRTALEVIAENPYDEAFSRGAARFVLPPPAGGAL